MVNEIPISVVDRKIKVGRHIPATMTNIGKDYLSISLDNEWSSTNHRIRVTLYSDAPYVSVQNWWDGKSAIEIPQEITSCPSFKITIANVSEDGYERLVTQAMDEPIENPRNGHDEGSEPGVRTMDIIARIDNLAADLEEKRDTDYWRGQPGKDADIAGAEAAKDAANKAAEAAINAAASVNNAAINANDSATKADEAATNADTATTNANAAAANAIEKASLAASKAVEAESAASEAYNAANELREAAERGDFDGSDGYSPTASVTKNGGTATITVTDKNGTTTATVSDGAPGSDAAATDVRINGKSITVDGVANIPATKGNSNNATENSYGVVKSRGQAYGIWVEPGGLICTLTAIKSDIDSRDNYFKPICSANLDYAVKAAMCDGKGAAWTADEQKAARERMNAADANKVYIMQKQIENLQGIVATEETDSTEAYTKTVPTGAQKWASLDKVGGKTVVWNQLQPNSVSRSTGGITFSYENGTLTATADGSTRDVAWWLTGTDTKISFKANHKYAIFGIFPYDRTYNTGWYLPAAHGQVNLYDGDGIYTISADSETYLQLMISAEYDMSSPIVCKPQIFDLTAMFGAGNEPTTLDDPRIAFIKAYADAHPEYNPGELMSAEVVEVESKGKNLTIVDTFPIPAEVREMCPGYGWSAGTVCNEIDLGRKVYVQKVVSVDLGTLKWNPAWTNAWYTDDITNVKPGNYGDKSFNGITEKYEIGNPLNGTNGLFNCWSSQPETGHAFTRFAVCNGSTNEKPTGLLYYELAEPIEVDLSDVLSDDHFIEVEAGGTVTFKQASTQLPVPSSVTYQISTKEAIANA